VVAVVAVVLVALGALARVVVPRFMICLPASLRMRAQTGCWVLASKDLGILPSGTVYWHIDRFSDRQAADTARGPNSTVVESYGAVWLLAVTSEAAAPTAGEAVAVIGPLPVAADTRYTAEYMEGTFSPGMRSIAHRHPGPEAFYNIEGEFCLETPGKKIVVGPNQGVFVEGGTPMQLTATGTQMRRSLVLVLRPSHRLLGTPTLGWRPTGLCAGAQRISPGPKEPVRHRRPEVESAR
jgi:quercetin dioxygenase-like cupin family protein